MGPCPVAPERLWKKAEATLHTCSALNMEAVETQVPVRKSQRTNYTNPHTAVCTYRSQKQLHGVMAQSLPQSSRGQNKAGLGAVQHVPAIPALSQLLFNITICNLFQDGKREIVTQTHTPLSPIP
ncbi:hypothetical protein HJG60_009836 [Phyllostomus discolor]|uniref:Uncharacterized protein n=1 Tax=Phyllostomus discolor TaxID=89673 RepID=A0A834EPZ3_9CHIR|nr:hypothetical protein HJG60_009836 [Phyllostomus discolor]